MKVDDYFQMTDNENLNKFTKNRNMDHLKQEIIERFKKILVIPANLNSSLNHS